MRTEADVRNSVTSSHVAAVKAVLDESPMLHVTEQELEAMLNSVWAAALTYFHAEQQRGYKTGP